MSMMRVEYPGAVMTWAIPEMTLLGMFLDFYEKNETQALGFFYEPGDRVLDCGAGIGVISALLCKIVGDGGYVVSVEALPEMLEFIKINLGLIECRNASIASAALLADDRKTVAFNRRTLLYASSLQESHDEVRNTIEVPAVNADNLVAEFKLGCLHLDMEGGEIAVFDTVDLG